MSNRNNQYEVGSHSIVHETAKIGAGTSIGRFCIISENVQIGENVRIMDYVKLMPGTVVHANAQLDDYVNTSGYCSIGQNTRVKRCTMIGQACYVGDNVWIGSHVTTTRIRYPGYGANAKNDEESIFIEEYAVIGSHALVLAGIKIGRHAIIGAGAIVSKNCVPYGVYFAKNTATLQRTMRH